MSRNTALVREEEKTRGHIKLASGAHSTEWFCEEKKRQGVVAANGRTHDEIERGGV